MIFTGIASQREHHSQPAAADAKRQHRPTPAVQLLDLTLDSPAENLALDEALLEQAESAAQRGEVLRLWESHRHAVVLGRSSHIDAEVLQENCRQLGLPILRRISGGAAVLIGPGCLMYSLVLDLHKRPQLRSLSQAHRVVLGTIAVALAKLMPAVRCQGISDLALDGRKFSGNSIRYRRNYLLYHGTVLYAFDLELVDRCLKLPPRQPDYRQGRGHSQFLTNLPLPSAAIRRTLAGAWNVQGQLGDWPAELTARLAAEKYLQPSWTAHR